MLYTFGYYLPTLLALATYRRRGSISVATGVILMWLRLTLVANLGTGIPDFEKLKSRSQIRTCILNLGPWSRYFLITGVPPQLLHQVGHTLQLDVPEATAVLRALGFVLMDRTHWEACITAGDGTAHACPGVRACWPSAAAPTGEAAAAAAMEPFPPSQVSQNG